ncbi:hypothetical protein GYMLUDRAFT_100681 [Collybiopsis luxurians FD-317 M1]|uniref:Uncharacterized protein n=1 Tax=Collybiopsis luxurians FD-317 M1 TaxID=944289 RepID=A0A0D0AQA6_9AGAR|nr:hypothetical protein GYMLUDRAFT_100681 [Collybiopsis luxurians FD-317 M1]
MKLWIASTTTYLIFFLVSTTYGAPRPIENNDTEEHPSVSLTIRTTSSSDPGHQVMVTFHPGTETALTTENQLPTQREIVQFTNSRIHLYAKNTWKITEQFTIEFSNAPAPAMLGKETQISFTMRAPASWTQCQSKQTRPAVCRGVAKLGKPGSLIIYGPDEGLWV